MVPSHNSNQRRKERILNCMCNAMTKRVLLIYFCHNSICLQSNVENFSPQIIRHLAKEMSELQKNPPEGVKVFINDEDITDVQASIEGPGNYTVQLFSEIQVTEIVYTTSSIK